MANLNEFFKDVLPESPHYILTRKVEFFSEKQDRNISGMQNVVSFQSNLIKSVERLFATNYSRNQDIYFATAGYDLPLERAQSIFENTKGDEVEKKRARRKYINKLRQSAYITGRKCLYIDIDRYKEDTLPANGLVDGRKVYHDMALALGDVAKAVKSLGLPKPTYVVFSGRGLHIYWATEDVMTLDNWRYMQMQINMLFFSEAKIEVDLSVAKNDNGVMRIPTSYNTKSKVYGELRKVGKLVPSDQLIQVLDDKFPRSQVTFSHASGSMLNGELPPDHVRAQMKLYNTSEWGGYDNPVPVWSTLTDPEFGCNFLRWCESEGKTELGNEEWMAMITAAVNCEGGDKLIHTLSEGHESYSYEDTENRAYSFGGIYSCASISGANTGKIVTEACKGCRYLTKDNKPVLTNPTHIMNRITVKEIEAEVQEEARPLVVINDAPTQSTGTFVETIHNDGQPLSLNTGVLTTTAVKSYMPKDYCILEPEREARFRDDDLGDGIGCKFEDPEVEGSYQLLRVTVGYIYLVDAIRDSVRNTIEFDFAVQQSDNVMAHVRLSSELLSSDEEVIKAFADVGVIHHLCAVKQKRHRTAMFLDYIRQSAIKRMNIDTHYTSHIKQFGWTADKSAFLLGEWLIYGEKRHERAHPTKACLAYVDAMTPPSDARVRKWAKGAELYAHKGMESAQFILGVSLASPVLGLLATADAQGALINIFSTESGLGKTTLAHSALSIWGRPAPSGNKLGLSGISNDTNKSRIFGMSLFQNIPYYMDETTDMKPQQSYQLVYQITQGQDARRMKQSGVELHDTVGGWNMVTMTSSNKSLVEKLYTLAGASGDAVHARVLEIDMRQLKSAREVVDEYGVSLYTHEEIQHAFRTMQSENYAIIGQDYLLKITERRDALVAEYEDIRRELNAIFKFQSFERFWANTAVLGIMGIRHGNHFGYFNFDESRVIAWLHKTLATVRSVRTEAKVDIKDVIQDFLINSQGQSITSLNGRDAKWVGGRPSIVSYRHNIENKHYQISVRAFKQYVHDQYGWTLKEAERAMDELCGTSKRYRFLSGLDDVGSENGSGQIMSWVLPYDLL